MDSIDQSNQLGTQLTQHQFKAISIVNNIFMLGLIALLLLCFSTFGISQLDNLAELGTNLVCFCGLGVILLILAPLTLVRFIQRLRTTYEFYENGMRVIRGQQIKVHPYSSFKNIEMGHKVHRIQFVPVARTFSITLIVQDGEAETKYFIDGGYTHLHDLRQLMENFAVTA